MLTKNTYLEDQITEMEESVFFHVNNLVLKAVANAEEKMKELLGDNLFRFSPLERVFSVLKVWYICFIANNTR